MQVELNQYQQQQYRTQCTYSMRIHRATKNMQITPENTHLSRHWGALDLLRVVVETLFVFVQHMSYSNVSLA